MWLGIIAALDKLLGIFGQLFGWWIKRSDASKKKHDEEQTKMDIAAKEGNFDDWKKARSRRNRA